ncbi:hypothetical protein H9P43_003514 [Blastocladiella emersonii ATCC 22665]|nr:hypothetical protein H9P43_003514 [Blastocladiella emersonii ATCC 22665]
MDTASAATTAAATARPEDLFGVWHPCPVHAPVAGDRPTVTPSSRAKPTTTLLVRMTRNEQRGGLAVTFINPETGHVWEDRVDDDAALLDRKQQHAKLLMIDTETLVTELARVVARDFEGQRPHLHLQYRDADLGPAGIADLRLTRTVGGLRLSWVFEGQPLTASRALALVLRELTTPLMLLYQWSQLHVEHLRNALTSRETELAAAQRLLGDPEMTKVKKPATFGHLAMPPILNLATVFSRRQDWRLVSRTSTTTSTTMATATATANGQSSTTSTTTTTTITSTFSSAAVANPKPEDSRPAAPPARANPPRLTSILSSPGPTDRAPPSASSVHFASQAPAAPPAPFIPAGVNLFALASQPSSMRQLDLGSSQHNGGGGYGSSQFGYGSSQFGFGSQSQYMPGSSQAAMFPRSSSPPRSDPPVPAPGPSILPPQQQHPKPAAAATTTRVTLELSDSQFDGPLSPTASVFAAPAAKSTTTAAAPAPAPTPATLPPSILVPRLGKLTAAAGGSEPAKLLPSSIVVPHLGGSSQQHTASSSSQLMSSQISLADEPSSSTGGDGTTAAAPRPKKRPKTKKLF